MCLYFQGLQRVCIEESFPRKRNGSAFRSCRDGTFHERLSVPASTICIDGTFVRQLSVSTSYTTFYTAHVLHTYVKIPYSNSLQTC